MGIIGRQRTSPQSDRNSEAYEAVSVSSGQAALHYSVLNLADPGCNIVSVPQLYGTTHTLFAHVLPKQGVEVRFAQTDYPEAIERLIGNDQMGKLFKVLAFAPRSTSGMAGFPP